MKNKNLRFRKTILLFSIFIALASTGGPAHAYCEKPKLLLILDRSVSMVGNTVPTGETRWEAACVAIGAITSMFEETIDFGLMLFPYPDRCSPGSVVVDIGPENAGAINDYLSAPVELQGNWTPMAQTIDAAAEYFSSMPGPARKVAVLITDGEQWCHPYDPATRFDPVDAAVAFLETGAALHVVGFGGEGVDALVLNSIAHLGGTALPGCDPAQEDPLAGDNCYHNAAGIDSLTSVLATIALRVTEEICDGIDNDCDSLIDEDLRRECSTSCGTGEEECYAGRWIGCNAPLPSPETCNGLDDDCDGTVDEGCACVIGEKRQCGTDEGECRAGVQQCEGAYWSECEGAIGPEPEICDGLDNDCNGAVDDNILCPDDEQPTGFEDFIYEDSPACGCTLVR